MAKTPTKSGAKKVSDVPASKKKEKPTAKTKAAPSPDEVIVKACEVSLSKLQELDLDHQLQSEINWCLGSYQNDHNPIGLYEMAWRARAVLSEALEKKMKGVTAKLIKDLEKALEGR